MRERRSSFLLGILCLAAASGASAEGEGGERLLILALDAVPFATMERLTAPRADGEGLFGDFAPPVPLISTFPSTTSIALVGILGELGLERSPGYEARFFDWRTERRRGGGPVSYFRVEFPWREYFDWNRKGPLRNALHAARPVKAGIGELDRALAAFEASGASSFTVYIADTDTAGHLFGPTGLDPILRALDADLRALRRKMGPGLRIVLFSDHGLSGGEPLDNVLPAVRRELSARGWRTSDRLERPTDVVLTPYGLVSSFEAYARPERVGALSSTLAGVPGVDLCVAPRESGWRLESAEYVIDFERRGLGRAAEWRWRLGGSDDRGVAAILASIAPQDTWVEEERVLAASAASAYPDPLHRLAGAFAAVDNPASVVCSLAAGYMFGSRGAERSARWAKGALRWTHGALHRQASLGFLMTSLGADSPSSPLRYDRALGAAVDTPTLALTSQ